MMAAAEARAAWQRTANRCFVQEDAKRAPKLACCSSKLQSDSCNGDTGNRLDDSSENSMPLNLNPTNSNLPPDTQWWLHLQPNFENQRDFTYKRLNTLKSELDDVGNGDLNPISTVHEEPMDSYLAFESQSTSMKHDSGSRLPDPKAVKIQHLVNHEIDTGENLKVDYGEYWFKYNDSMDWKSVDLLISDRLKKVSTDSTTPCVGVERTGPWWHTADKDELASLVAQKSLEHIENCDLPPPQKMHVGGGPFTDFECFDPEANTSLDRKICPSFCNPVERATNFPDGGSASGKESGSSDLCRSLHDSEKLISSTNSMNKGASQSKHHSKSDPSKAQLLEALRHSQTRAREAEKAAQQAYCEKEHILKLFFRQASHLFAYKQWLQLLQLEALYLQLKYKDHQLSIFPSLPWMSSKGRYLGNPRKRRKVGEPKHEVSKFAFAFALGLGLAGAGVILGWNMGWLLPAS